MGRPIGIRILAASFFSVAACLVFFANWLFFSNPEEPTLEPVGFIVVLAIAVAILIIGIGILQLRNVARRAAFSGLALMTFLAFAAIVYDAGLRRDSWLFVDSVLALLFAIPAVYLLTPGVVKTFSRVQHGDGEIANSGHTQRQRVSQTSRSK